MSIRKRTYEKSGNTKWAVDYFDQTRKRRHKTFKSKAEAKSFAATAATQVEAGTHVADSATCTVAKAGEIWLAVCKRRGIELATYEPYEQHLNLHITPFIGSTLLSKLTPPLVTAFEDKLHENGRSPDMIRRVMVSLSAILAVAYKRGLVAQNVIRNMKSKDDNRGDRLIAERHEKRIVVGVDLPTPQEAGMIIKTAEGQWRPFFMTAIFTGLRASELRGLPWSNVDFEKREIHVTQRADRYCHLGPVKTKGSFRTVPMTPMLINTLKQWKLICPKGDLNLVFPNGKGRVEDLMNIRKRGQIPTVIKAGLAINTGKRDENKKPIMKAKYEGMHAFRHFYASWCINRREDGGLGLPIKEVQTLMGHSSIQVTIDTYSHLFPRSDDSYDKMAAAEKKLLGY